MTSILAEILLGIYLGLLTGIIPAVAAGSLGFLVRYVTGVTLPGFGVVVLALSIASVNGGLLGLVDPTIVNTPRLFIAALVVLMLSLYAHSQGDKLGAELPRRISLRNLGRRTLSADVVEFAGGIGHVTIRPEQPIRDLEGYPSLPADLRTTIANLTWQLPADLPLGELERRLEDRLQTDYDLANVIVSLDSRGRATIAAGPPTSGLSRRVPPGKRAVSVRALLPTGLTRGERLTLELPNGSVDGTLLSARSDANTASPVKPITTDESEEATASTPPPAPTTSGGEGRVTIAVSRQLAGRVLDAAKAGIVVQPRSTTPEFEVLSSLRRSGYRIQRLTVGTDCPKTSIETLTSGESNVRVLAIRRSNPETPASSRGILSRLGPRSTGSGTSTLLSNRRWHLVPEMDVTLQGGDQLFVVGRSSAVRQFTERVS